MRADRALCLTLAALAALFGVYLRVRLAASMPNFDPDDDTAYFHVEGAFQYRYAKMLAFGIPIPAVDKDAQWPEGVRVGRDVSLLMERATAWTYAAAGASRPKDAFHGFVMLWICGFSALAALALYFLCLRLSADPPLAAACAFLYAASWLACSITAGTYGFQSFALPLLACAVAALCGALDETLPSRRRDLSAAAAAGLVATALVAWHFSRFFLATIWLALFWAAARAGSAQARARVARAAAWLCAGAALAGIAPVLRETRFWVSPAFLLGPALWALAALERRRAAVFCAALAAAAFLSRSAESAAYGHVWSLLADKLRLGLVKPEDPALLSTSSRLLWSGPFNSPELGMLLFAFVPLGLPALAAVLPGRSKSPAPESRRVVEALTLAYLLGSALVSRLTTPLAFFVCALPAAAAPAGRRRTLALWAVLAAGGWETCKTLYPGSPYNPMLVLAALSTPRIERPTGSYSEEKAMLEWLRRRGERRPTAANFGVSAALLAYGEVPVLLHPKFETEAVRLKTAEYLAALYGSEEDLFAYCRRYGAGLLLHSGDAALDESKDGPRYMSGARALSESSAAFRLQFDAPRLKRFRLLYENEDFRVFDVGVSTRPLYAGEPDPIYDLAQFSPVRREDGTVALDVQGALSRRSDARMQVALARVYVTMKLGRHALAAYDNAFALWPPTTALREEALRLRAALIKARP